jgi:hypothetical protein
MTSWSLTLERLPLPTPLSCTVRLIAPGGTVDAAAPLQAPITPIWGLETSMEEESNETTSRSSMPSPTYTTTLSIAELEASYPLYCKAMRILIRDGATEDRARRTVCWNRLETLHHSLPRQYRHPQQLFARLQSDILREFSTQHMANMATA